MQTILQDEENKAYLKDWVVKTFTVRECVRFVTSKSYKEKCGCGRRYEDHRNLLHQPSSQHSYRKDDVIYSPSNTSIELDVWKIQDCTAVYPTNAFGVIEFQGADSLSPKAEYIRLSFDTKPQNIIKLLKNYWQLELPKLIISVHGGIANFGLQPKLKQAIQRALIKVANTSYIWIITAGTDTGVVKHVGDMLREYLPKRRSNVVVIGIAPWGVVNDKESLIGSGIEVPYYSNNRTINITNSFNLNNCHSYFLLVDDGTVGKYGCEISLRRRLERFLSRHKSEIYMDFDMRPKILDVTIEEKITLQNHHTIPLVCLVIEGGTNTIQTVLINVNDKPPVPVVVCDGSGRAADLVAFTHRYVNINPVTRKPSMEADVKEQLILTIMKTFAYSKDQAEYLFIQLMNCINNKDLISIYRLGDDEDNQEIDIAILTASLKAIDLHLSKQLDIIMSWNRPDIAKKYIYLQGSDTEKRILEDKMFDALAQDKVDFVSLYLEYGVNLHKFLTFKRLQDLYNYKKGPSNTLLLIVKDVVKKMEVNHTITLVEIGLVIEKLIGSGYISEYSKKDFKQKYLKFLYRSSCLANKPGIFLFENNEKDEMFRYPYNELLIWAVLMKRHKMAMFVCKRGEETLAKAIVAAKLNKALAKEAELDDLDSEISDEFKKYAEDFGVLAVGLLDKCYKENDDLTSQLLTYDLINWSHWTCMSLAVSANLKDLMSHAACQLLISDLWMGGMKIRKYITYKVIAALLFPPFIFAIQFKSAAELQYMPQTQEEYEQQLESQDQSDDSSDESSNDSVSLRNNTKKEDISKIQKTSDGKLPDLEGEGGANGDNKYTEAEYLTEVPRDEENRVYQMLNLDQIIELYDAQNFPSASNYKNLKKSRSKSKLDMMMDEKKTTMNFMVRKRADKLRFGKKIYEFYNAPITKFWQNAIIYILFLLAQAYIVLVKTPWKPSLPELFVIVYIFSYGFDKIRELLQTDSPRFSGKIKIFFSKTMNLLDIFFILTIIVAFVFRMQKKESHQTVARLIYCVNTIYWIIKLMEFLLINKYIGPLIIIASRMLKDLFNFVIILLILLMSFGLSRQAIKFPNEEFRWELVKQIFLEPYFMLYGEVYADTIDPPCNITEDKNSPQCQMGHWITPLTMTAFMIVACLLFLTVLIASFNNTYARINRQSNLFWKSQRYHLVTAFEAKPLLAPPFVVLSHIFLIVKYSIRFCLRRKIKFDRKLKAFLSEEMIQRLHDFEENCVYQYSCDVDQQKADLTDEKVGYTKNKVDGISERIDDIFFKENMTKLSLYKVEVRLQKLEEFTYETINQLNTIANLLRVNTAVDLKSSMNEILNIETIAATSSTKPRYRRQTTGCTAEESSSEHLKQSISRQLSKSSLNKNKSCFTNSNNSDQTISASISLVNRQRNQRLNESNRIDGYDESTIQKKRARTLKNKVSIEPKLSDADDDQIEELKNMTEKENDESKYLEKINKKIMSKKSMKSNNSSRSSSNTSIEESDDLMNKSHKKAKPFSSIVIKVNRSEGEDDGVSPNKTKIDKTTTNKSENSSSSDSDSKSTRKILSEIYRNQLDEQQQYLSLAASQASYTLDQYTIHPYVYLHSVVKPPLAEYTSITDNIDTSNIDRPSSPNISLSKSNHFFPKKKSPQPTPSAASTAATSINKSSDEYCTKESTRSIVARQESEILRLVEESQHVIISQMLNKIVAQNTSTTPISSSSPEMSSNAAKETETKRKNEISQSKLTGESEIEHKQNEEKSPHAKVMFSIEDFKAKITKFHIHSGHDDENEEVNQSKSASENSDPASGNTLIEDEASVHINRFQISEENEFAGKLASNRNNNPKSKKNKSFREIKRNNEAGRLPIPLSTMDRNSSQIFYAQSQASALCLEDDIQEEKKPLNSKNSANKK